MARPFCFLCGRSHGELRIYRASQRVAHHACMKRLISRVSFGAFGFGPAPKALTDSVPVRCKICSESHGIWNAHACAYVHPPDHYGLKYVPAIKGYVHGPCVSVFLRWTQQLGVDIAPMRVKLGLSRTPYDRADRIPDYEIHQSRWRMTPIGRWQEQEKDSKDVIPE